MKYKAIIFPIILLFITACSQQPPSTTPTGTPSTQIVSKPGEPSKPVWEQRWNELLQEARKDEKLIITTLAAGEVRHELSRVFKEKTGIELEFVMGRAAEVLAKLRAERRAGLYLVDVHLGGGTTPINQYKPEGMLDPLMPLLLLPEVTDPKVWFDGKLPFVDKERQYIFSGSLGPSSPLLINTDMVKPEEIKSYKDLLTPKWKGKIVVNDPTVAGVGVRWFGFMVEKAFGAEFMRELAKQEPVIIRDLRLQVEWIAKGRYPILAAPQPDVVAEFLRVAAPISYLTPQEGTYLAGMLGVIAFYNRAPHPRAAQVFINWFLGKEGQTLYSRATNTATARVDVDMDFLSLEQKRLPNVEYFITEDEKFLLGQPKMMELGKEIFGHLMR